MQTGKSTSSDKIRALKPQAIDTGFAKLNRCLRVGGWPLHTTTEIGLSTQGIGELRLLIPALRQLLRQQQGEMLWIAPPYLPHARALLKEQLDTHKLTLVEASSKVDILWCAEQALKADCCAAVITWSGAHALTQRETRRLQLAAERTTAWHVQFRHADCLQYASAAQLRLQLAVTEQNRLAVQISKQPQGWQGQQCELSLPPAYEQWQRISVQSLPLNNRQPLPSIQRRRVADMPQVGNKLTAG